VRRRLAAVLLLAACRDAEPQADAASGSTPATSDVVSRELSPASPPVIELVDPGAEPREPLRLRPVAGTESALDVALSLRMTVRAGGTEAPPLGMPTVVVHGRVIVDSVTDDEIRVRHLADAIELEDGADVPAELRAELQRAVDGLAAYRASLRVDPRGFVRGGVIDVPSGAQGPAEQILAQLGQAYGQALVAAPVEPVGVGARWVETRDVDQSGMKLRQTTTYELRSRTSDAIEVHAEVVQSLRAADFSGGLVPGVRAKLVKFSGKGTVDTSFDLGAASPRTSEHRTDVRMILDVDAAGETSRQEIDLALELSMSRPPSP
jgi:hypothetical protein